MLDIVFNFYYSSIIELIIITLINKDGNRYSSRYFS